MCENKYLFGTCNLLGNTYIIIIPIGGNNNEQKERNRQVS
jgi:hypothetical protein